jgi:hypothetical protein
MRKDIQLDDNNDLLFANGDLVVGESDRQNVKLIVESQMGEWKEFPTVGFGIDNYLKKNRNDREFKRDLKVQLEQDGYKNTGIDLTDGYSKLKIEI